MSLNKEEEQTEIVSMWVTPKAAKEINMATDPETKERILIDYARRFNAEMKSDIEALDDDVAQYKGLLASYRQKLKETQKQHRDAVYSTWETFDNELEEVRKKSGKIADSMRPVKQELDDLNSKLDRLRSYDLERLLELINMINSNYNGETKDILKFLFESYYKK